MPVGGGCRKSRRSSKSIRPPLSTSYSSRDLTSSSNNSEDSNTPPGSTNESGIDLAAVFAKFLNQNYSSNTELVSGLELPDAGHASVNIPTDGAMIEGQKPPDIVADGHLHDGVSMAYLDDDHKLQQQEVMIQEFTRPEDPNIFGLHALLSDQVVEDALWSDATALPSFTWQPMVQLQEFDQTSSMNLLSDNMRFFQDLENPIFME